MSAYYNDHDPFACSWLRELIGAGLLPEGEVDERSILDVEPGDLRPFRQCHFFAGIGGWPRALALARFPQACGIWTASLPCQPLSVAGQRKGDADERHLWSAFYRLLAVGRPAIVVGEQVASLDGREWLAGIFADLGEAGYACGAANLPAAGVGAPHWRERLYWCALADAEGERRREGRPGHAMERRRYSVASAGLSNFWDDAEWRVGADGKARRVKPGVRLLAHGVPNRVGRLRGYGNAIVPQIAARFVEAVMGALDGH